MPNGNIMCLGTGEIVQGGAIAFFGDNAQVHLHAAFEDDAGACWTCRQCFGDFIIGREIPHYRVIRCCRDHDVEICNGLAHTPVAARDSYLFYPGRRFYK